MTVSVDLLIDTEELSAQSSTTARAEKGYRPKKVTVSLEIRHKDAADLTRLTALAESVRKDGKATVYNVVSPVCHAMKVRQVTFVDNFRVTEIADRRAWAVSFMLAEHVSVPEKKEQRKEIPPAAQQTPSGTVPAPSREQEVVQLTSFEKVLAALDSALA